MNALQVVKHIHTHVTGGLSCSQSLYTQRIIVAVIPYYFFISFYFIMENNDKTFQLFMKQLG